MLEIGTKAPIFTLMDKDGNTVSLSDFAGKKVVLYFYPKDNTPGCTRQACAFAGAYAAFQERNVVVIGISKDSTASHQKFAEKHSLPFILLSDPERQSIEAYGVWQEKKLYGKVSMGVVRATYIIDEGGNIENVMPKVKPDTNAAEILDYLRGSAVVKRAELNIGHIPALLWGEPSDRLIIAVHGNLSHKADTVIALLAQRAVAQGYRVLSFDLPQHGERKGEPTLCKAQTCVEELQSVMAYAKTLTSEISLFGCSIGAYFSLLAYCNEPLKQALFLSPVVDMERLIGTMMTWFSVSEERLQTEGEVPTPIGQTLYWDYYQYVKAHPVNHWNTSTKILYGSADNLCEQDTVEEFTRRFGCDLNVLEGGEHFFHTGEQLAFYESWIKAVLK